MVQYRGPVEEPDLTIAQKLRRDQQLAAFPVNVYEGRTIDGMTLRDYFAGQALANLAVKVEPNENSFRWTEDELAEECYDIADAMLKARHVE
jgi:hypothetical protein